MASYYPRLKYLNPADYRPGNIHPLLKIKCSSSIEISRIPPKLKMLTGTYILQTKIEQKCMPTKIRNVNYAK